MYIFSDNKWRERRRILNHSFGANIMYDFVKIFNKVYNKLVKKLGAETNKDWVELLDFTNYASLDIVLGTIMFI